MKYMFIVGNLEKFKKWKKTPLYSNHLNHVHWILFSLVSMGLYVYIYVFIYMCVLSKLGIFCKHTANMFFFPVTSSTFHPEYPLKA